VDIAALLHAHGKRRRIKPPLQGCLGGPATTISEAGPPSPNAPWLRATAFSRLLSIERRAVISARMTGWVDRPQAALVYVRRMSSSVA